MSLHGSSQKSIQIDTMLNQQFMLKRVKARAPPAPTSHCGTKYVQRDRANISYGPNKTR